MKGSSLSLEFLMLPLDKIEESELTPPEQEILEELKEGHERAKALMWIAEKTGLDYQLIDRAYKLVIYYSTLSPWSSYRKIVIPKRDGKGRRICWEPIEPLKSVQKGINRLLSKIPRHPNSFGLSGGGVKEAIEVHLGSKALFQIDIKDAFHQITRERIIKSLSSFSLFHDRVWVVKIIAQLCTFPAIPGNGTPVLPQGAPSSPRLFDIAMRSVDERLNALSTERRIRYSRYADNLLFSGAPSALKKARGRIIREIGMETHYGHIQDLSRPTRVLGLNIIGDSIHNTRQHKRLFRAVIHFTLEELKHGDDRERLLHLISVYNGLKGWIQEETLTPSILREKRVLENKIWRQYIIG